MTSLFNFAFWFNLRPGSMLKNAQITLLTFIAILIICAVIFFIYKRKKGAYKHFFSSLYSFSLTNAIFGLMLLFFNYELVPFFAAHFWFLIWGTSFIWWLFYIIKDFKKLVKKQKESPKNDDIKKYLP